jgi:hypothetical protein
MFAGVPFTVYPDANAIPTAASVPTVAGRMITKIGSVDVARKEMAIRE